MTYQEIDTTIALHDGFSGERIETKSLFYRDKVSYYLVRCPTKNTQKRTGDGCPITISKGWGEGLDHNKTSVYGDYPYYTTSLDLIQKFVFKQSEAFQVLFDDLLKSRHLLVCRTSAIDWYRIVVELLNNKNNGNRQKD